MPTRRNAAKQKDETSSEQRHGMTKAEACKVLQVAPSAEEDLVTNAYWHLATKLRALAARDPEARRKLDELNRAYLVLNPTHAEAPLSNETPTARDEPRTSFPGEFASWGRRTIDQTVARWPNRAPELAILTGTTVFLGYLAITSGANQVTAIIALVAALVTIWAPWRPDGRG